MVIVVFSRGERFQMSGSGGTYSASVSASSSSSYVFRFANEYWYPPEIGGLFPSWYGHFGSCSGSSNSNGDNTCTAGCGTWSDRLNQCGSHTCTRTDCSIYVATKNCDPGSSSTENPVVSIFRPSNYELGTLSVGEKYYVDRGYVVESLPSKYDGLLLIKTANADKSNSGLSFSFDVDRSTNIFVVFDSRITPPFWLSSSFTKTNEKIGLSDPSVSFLDVWRGEFPSGSVVLGGTGASSNFGSMYFVFLEGVGEANNNVNNKIGCGFGIGVDTNGDSKVDFLDLVCLARNIGGYLSSLDLNSDGSLNVLDLIFVARVFDS